MKNFLFLLIQGLMLFFTSTAPLRAQSVEMADLMRSNGKIYVVVAVLTVILTGVLVYLIRIDLKIKKIEKENS